VLRCTTELMRQSSVAPCLCAAALLPALAVFDLPGFVLLLSRRLAAGGAEPSSPTHVMSFLALLRLAHSQQASRRELPQTCFKWLLLQTNR
jgi:hypothetical protein